MTAVTSRPATAPAWLRMAGLRGMRWLVLTHRWLGIVTCLLCAMWFVSGLVMVYVPYPGLSDRDRMTWSEPLVVGQVAVTPDQALAAAGLSAWPDQLKLTMLRGEPVWRMVDGKRRLAVSAVDGHRVGPTSAAEAAETVRRLLPGREVAAVRTRTRDQWTVAQGFDPHRPLHRVDVKGPEGLRLYVSSKTGEVVNDTTRWERGWNWFGSIPHWIYPTVLRKDNAAWRQVIMWTSGPALIGAMAGIWLGIVRIGKRGRPFSPFRGWMQWHHVAGLVGGAFALTWLFSGWLSVNPFQWFPRRNPEPAALAAYAGHAAASFPADAATLRRLPIGAAREARLVWVGGAPRIVLMGPSLAETSFDAATAAAVRPTDEDLFSAAKALVPGAPVTAAQRLTQPDAYWYSTQRDLRRLPVLRVEFGDARQTWVHIDPETGEILGQMDSTRRLYRWLFNAVHAWDLPVFGGSEIVRQVVVWVLSLGGLVLSISGVVIGWRHLNLTLGARPRTKRSAA